jgi:hypothetical protein
MMTLRHRHVVEFFRIVCWLWDAIDPASPAEEAFKRRFAAMLDADTVEEAEVQRRQLESDFLQGIVLLQKKNSARFWFQNSVYLIREGLYKEAFDGLHICSTLVKEDDPAAYVQLLTKFAHVKMNQVYIKYAIQDYMAILTTLKNHPDIPFSEGTAAGMQCNAYIQLANCFVGTGHPDFAYREINHAVAIINHWISHAEDDVVSGVQDGVAKDLILLPMPKLALEHRLPHAAMWITLSNLTSWVYGIVLMWECRLSEEAAARPLQQLRSFVFTLYKDLMGNLQTARLAGGYANLLPGLQQIYRQSAAMARLGAEATFVLSQLDVITLEVAIMQANGFIDIALHVHEQTGTPDQYKHVIFSVRLLEYYRDWWNIALRAQVAGSPSADILPPPFDEELANLCARIEAYVKEYQANTPEDDDLKHFVGRYYTLLGQLYLTIKKEDRADAFLHEARAIFSSEGPEGFLPREMEVDRILNG